EVKFETLTAERPIIDMPNNQWSLASVDVDDGRGNVYTRKFRHRAIGNDLRNPSDLGTGFYDRVEREDYGFALTTTTREDGSELESQAHNKDFYRAGLVHDTIERDGT